MESIRLLEIAVAITACPREGADYLPQTLNSVKSSGFYDPVIMAESGTVVPLGGKRVQSKDDGHRRGPWLQFLNCLRFLLDADECEGQPDAVLIFQDDIRVSRGMADYLQESLRFLYEDEARWSTVGAISCYCPAHFHSETTGWTETPDICGSKADGALAILMPVHAARKLLADPQTISRNLVDFQIGEFCCRNNLSFWRHSPSLVKHMGVVSAIANRRNVEKNPLILAMRDCKVFCEDCADL